MAAGEQERPPIGRGHVQRTMRVMSAADTEAFLQQGKVAHVGTVDQDGWPYVIPLVYIYEGGPVLWLHTGARGGLFLTNVQHDARVCLEVCEMGPLHKGAQFACDSSLVYTSVVAYGRLTIVEEMQQKAWFFDQLLAKYGKPEWQFEPGYPHLDKIVLYAMNLEIVTGKHSEGLRH